MTLKICPIGFTYLNCFLFFFYSTYVKFSGIEVSITAPWYLQMSWLTPDGDINTVIYKTL